MDITNVHIIGISHGIFFLVYPQTTLLVPQMYTNINSHRHKIIKLTWDHLLQTCNI